MLEIIKKHLNIDNYSLANYIGTSKEFIDSVAINRRTLPLTLALKFLEIKEALAIQTNLNELLEVQNFLSKENNDTTKLIKKLSRRLELREITLTKTKAQRKLFLRGLQACNTLLKSPEITKKQQKWIKLREEHLKLILQKKSALEITRLESQIIGLKAELNFLKNKESF